jgi:RNA ligase (TIGR02306 family)
MSALAVIGLVTEIKPIEGADRIQQAFVDCGDAGVWSGVVGKDINVGDKTMVFLQDAILPPSALWLFMEKHKWRVRMARFKGVPSECVIIPAGNTDLEVGTDIAESLGVTKYEKKIPMQMLGQAKGNFPSFIPKTDEENFQRIRDLDELLEYEDLYAAIKYDGTSCTIWNDESGLHVCSRNWELDEFTPEGKSNIYWEMANKYFLSHVQEGVALQFEIIGPSIQGNPLGLTQNEIRVFTAYSLESHKRLPFAALVALCQNHDLPMAKVISSFYGNPGADTLRNMADSAKYGNGTPAEGIVVRDVGSSEISFKVLSLNYKD